MLEKLRPSELTVGKRTTLDIYTKSGRLLLSRGAMISNEQQIEILMQRGLVKRAPKDRVDFTSEFKPFRYTNKVNPFLEISELEDQLNKAFSHVKSNNTTAPEVFYRDLRTICSQLLGLTRRAPEALLGVVHWPREEKNNHLYHPIQCAILIALVALRLKVHSEQLFSTLAATLTANLGMLALQKNLNHQKTPLSTEQMNSLRAHPEKSVSLLKSLGIRDPIWLKAVLHHHERIDGSGYPQGLKDKDISNEGKLIALADIYTALISRREYRQALVTRQKLIQTFSERAALISPVLSKVFISQLGCYPPGTAVKLKNGDTAVITQRGVDLNYPLAAAIRAISGQVYMHPPPRDTRLPEYAIIEVLSSDTLKNLQPFLFWGVHVRKAIEL